MKSFNLSSKIRDLEHEPYQDHLLLDDVKEFIRLREDVIHEFLKKEICCAEMWLKLNALAGEALI